MRVTPRCVDKKRRYLSVLLLFLFGCATYSQTQTEKTVAAAYSFQAACMAAEQDEQYDSDCTRARYHLCREAWREAGRIWYCQQTILPRDKDGYPRTALEQRQEMAWNNCYPRL